MTLGAASLGIPPRIAALLVAHCQRQDRARARPRFRFTIGGRDCSAQIVGYRIEMFGPAPRPRDWWRYR